MLKKPLVIVIWDDARGDKHNEVTEDQLPHRPTLNKTIGWLLRDDSLGVSIANEHVTDGDVECYRGHDFIPRGMIRSVSHFNLVAPRKKRTVPNETPHPPDPVAGN